MGTGRVGKEKEIRGSLYISPCHTLGSSAAEETGNDAGIKGLFSRIRFSDT